MAEDQPKSFVVLDFETTGLDPRSSEILEAGAVRVSIPDLRILERWESLVKPVGGVPPFISRLTGIEPEHVADAPPWEEVRPKLLEFLGESPIAAHNSAMEQSFLEAHASRIAGEWDIWDTLEPLTLALPELPSHSLENLRAQAGLVSEGSHRALKDAEDTALLLKYAQDKLLRDRPGVAATVKELQEGREEWVWSWLFEAVAPAEAPGEVEPPFWGDLRKLKAQDQSREPEWNKSVTTDEVGALLREGVARAGLEYRTVQERMAADVAKALLVGERVAIEAPTGTGKSVAYLLPGVLAAERTGAPLVVATHSKGLQDQLLNKDVPAVARLLGRTGDGAEDGQPGVRAAVVKGQNNYLCLRKFHEECAETLSRDSSLMAWWPVAFLRSLAQVERPVELDRVPRILRERFPYLSELVERSRSHHTTTLGPTCPYYKQCHFFDSARRAHNADVIIANHALVFQWPQGLPKIRNLVLDEAHHLEERITEAFTVSVSGEDISERARRLGRKKAARSATSSAGDAETIAARVETVFKGDAAALLREDAESVRAKVVQVETVLGVAFGAGGGRGGGFYRADTLSLDPPGAAIAEGVRDRVIDSLRELRAAVDGVATRMEGWLKDMGQSGDGGEDDRAVDILKGYADAFGASRGALDLFLDRGGPDYVRLLHRNARDGAWRLEVTPVDVSGLAAPLFEGKRALVLTSATMTPGQSNPFVLERVGLKDSTKMVQLPSPYQVEKQAQAYITPDAPEPGTPQHLDALVELTARVARALGGRTLLLMTSNVRLREASSRLHAMLKDDGIQVFDSATEQRAAEAFVASDRAVLLGGERYGEGLDIPGPKLTCVILEKIHEGMTRGHLAEARKARARSPIFEYDFPLRMIWLKQRVGRLIRSPSDKGAVIIFDPRVARWSHTSRKVVLNALAPMPVSLVTSGDAVAQVASRYGH